MRCVSARCSFEASSVAIVRAGFFCESVFSSTRSLESNGSMPTSAQALPKGSRFATAAASGACEQTTASRNVKTAATAVASNTPRELSPCDRAPSALPHAASMQAKGTPTKTPSITIEARPYSAGRETEEPMASNTA